MLGINSDLIGRKPTGYLSIKFLIFSVYSTLLFVPKQSTSIRKLGTLRRLFLYTHPGYGSITV